MHTRIFKWILDILFPNTVSTLKQMKSRLYPVINLQDKLGEVPFSIKFFNIPKFKFWIYFLKNIPEK